MTSGESAARSVPDASIAESLEEERAVYAAASVGLAGLDAQGSLRVANRALGEILGRPRNELLGLPLQQLLELGVAAPEAILPALPTCECLQREFLYMRPDGGSRWLSLELAPRRDGSAGLLGYVAVVCDIDPRKRAEAELAQAVRGSEVFIGLLGHGLRNSLTAIATGVHLLASRGPDLGRLERVAERVVTNVVRMSNRIDQLLDFASLRNGAGVALQGGDVDLHDACKAVVDELTGDRAATVAVQVFGDTRGCWDRQRLLQLIANLVDNALQHRTPHTPVVVTLDGTKSDLVVIDVWNRGAIPASVLPLLFEPLRRAASKHQPASGGLGLGLFLSQQIALAHAGRIEVNSSELSGTHVTVRLPRHLPAG